VVETTDADFAPVVGGLIDLDQFARFFAVEIAMAAEDSYSFGRNNYYMFHRPSSDRFVFLPHGQDTALENPALDPHYPPPARLASRVRVVPETSAEVDGALSEITAVGGAFDVAALEARIDEAVAAIVATDRDDPFTAGDVAQLVGRAPVVKAQLAYRRQAILGTAAPPACGDGVLHRGEQCDDGNLLSGDSCDGTCRPECINVTLGASDWRLCPAARNWAESIAACEAEGGTLFVPTDSTEASLLASTLRAHFASVDAWLAITDTATDGTWLTADGAAVPYLGFPATEPNGDTEENCAILDTSLAGGWRDRNCDFDYAAICRMP
jgi:cysteine-rich repeat protein